MALIDCPECALEVSARATFCPRCGFPIAKEARRHGRQGNAHGGWGLAKAPLTSLDVTRSIVGRLVLAGLFFASGVGFEAPPTIILSLVLAGSSVPLYLKARRAERLGTDATVDPAVIEEAVERRLLEAEDRTLGQLAEVDRNAGRIADLEERLEFMERLLAKQRGED
jgi:hypothetical protein